MTGRWSGAAARTATLAALLGLATLSLCLSKVDLGSGQTAIALGIAAAKAALVALIFMGLARARGSVVAAMVAAVVLTMAMILLVAMDVETRPNAASAPAAPADARHSAR